jgi:hypothetical protein
MKILARPRRRTQPDTLLDRRLDQILTLFEQYAETAERTWLESHGTVVQANEILRDLRATVQKSPLLTANAVSLAVGSTLAEAGFSRQRAA